MKAKKYNFTKQFIESLSTADKGLRNYYKDSKIFGLEIMVTDTGLKSFKVRRKKNNKDIKVTLGRYPDISIEKARDLAFKINSEISQGVNPNKKKKDLSTEITFKQLFTQFMERYSKKFKKSWKYDEREVNKFLNHWFGRKISTISNVEIRDLHNKIHDNNGLIPITKNKVADFNTYRLFCLDVV